MTRDRTLTREADRTPIKITAGDRRGVALGVELPNPPVALQRSAGNQASLAALDIQVHRDEEAKQLTEAHDALGLAKGRDVYISPSLNPDSAAGKHVLAHELAHVVQQARRPSPSYSSTAMLEHEADAAADAGSTFGVKGRAEPGAIQEETSLPPGFVEQRLIPELTTNAEAWKRYIDVPAIAEVMRQHSWIQRAYRNDLEFQQWKKDPSYRPLATKTAAAVPIKPFVPPTAKPGAPASSGASPEGSLKPQYFDASGKPVTGPVTESPLEGSLRAPSRPPDWATQWNQMTPEQRAKAARIGRMAPKQRWQAAKQGPLPRFVGEHERALKEFEDTLKMIPGARAGVSFAQAGWGEDILGIPVGRGHAISQGFSELVLDASMVLGPEDLMVGSGSSAPLEGGLREAAAEVERDAARLAEREAAQAAERKAAAEIPVPEAEPIENVLEPTITPPAEQPEALANRGVELPEEAPIGAKPEELQLGSGQYHEGGLAKAEPSGAEFSEDPRDLLSLHEQQRHVQFSPDVNRKADWRSASRFEPPPGGGVTERGPRTYIHDAAGNPIEASTTDLTLGVRDRVMYSKVPGMSPGEDYGHLLGIDFGHIDAELGRYGGFRQAAHINRPMGAQAALWYDAERAALDQALNLKRADEPFRVVAQARGFVKNVPAETRIFVESSQGIVFDSGWISNPVTP